MEAEGAETEGAEAEGAEAKGSTTFPAYLFTPRSS